jgi:hypothetical protein
MKFSPVSVLPIYFLCVVVGKLKKFGGAGREDRLNKAMKFWLNATSVHKEINAKWNGVGSPLTPRG